jgi:hypothetical protein
LQALVTLNDSAFVDIAQHFARRMQHEGGKTVASQLQKGYEWMTGHELPKPKQEVLEKLYQEALIRFQKYPKKREDWMCNSTAEVAALAFVANTMLNMDEFITKQ